MQQMLSDIPVPVSYVRSDRARHLRITIRPEPSVTVTVPRRATMEEARHFAASRQAWIRRHVQRMLQHPQPLETPPPDLSKIDLAAVQEELFARLRAFSKQHNLPYRRAAFRCQKTKWGSCSAQNAISLNINMIFLPRHLQDYLLLHELTHVLHKHHKQAFWAELDRLCGGTAKALSKELKRYKINLF